jgi:hypothetical protein
MQVCLYFRMLACVYMHRGTYVTHMHVAEFAGVLARTLFRKQAEPVFTTYPMDKLPEF